MFIVGLEMILSTYLLWISTVWILIQSEKKVNNSNANLTVSRPLVSAGGRMQTKRGNSSTDPAVGHGVPEGLNTT